MTRPLLPPLIGVGLLCMGALFMFGWLARMREILTAIPGFLLVLNTSLCFVLAGLALIADGGRDRLRTQIQSALGAVMMIFSAAVLAEHVFTLDLGIDWREQHLWLSYINAHPGRMAVLTCIAFILSGATLILQHRVTSATRLYAVRCFTFAVGTIGIIAIIGHTLQLQQVFETYLFSQVALPAAGGFVALSAGLWSAWRGETWNAPRLFKSDVSRIMLASAVVMTAIALICGLASFTVMQHYNEKSLSHELTRILRNRVVSLTQIIEKSVNDAARFNGKVQAPRQLAVIAAEARIEGRSKLLQTFAEEAIELGYSAADFKDAAGTVIASAGQHLTLPELIMPLKLPYPAALLWSDQFILRTEIAINHLGRPLGSLILEQPLPELQKLLNDIGEIGETGELLFCALKESTLACAPSRLRTQPFFVPRATATDRSPAWLASKGESGAVKYVDARGIEAIGAYAPAGGLGLIAVLRMNSTVLYAPIREQLMLLMPVVLIFIVAGIVLLRASIAPLARKLTDSEQRLQLALDGSHLALWDWDVINRKVYLSEQWQQIIGGEARPSVTTPEALQGLVHPDDLPALGAELRAVMKGQRNRYNVQHRVRVLDGTWKWIHSKGMVVDRRADGYVIRLAGTNADINERKQTELLVAHQAGHDALTGLPNRALFNEHLMQAMGRSKRYARLMAVFYLDIDKFKTINDTFGHGIGDLLLNGFAQRLRECVRNVDTVSRLGGDEFTMILEELHQRDNGRVIAQKLIDAMRTEFVLENRSIKITTSIGIAFYDGSFETTPDALIKQADQALYEAKGQGRNNYRETARVAPATIADGAPTLQPTPGARTATA